MIPSTSMPWAKPQFFTDAGAMASSYKLFSYDTGTTNKRNTYTTSVLSVANANPIVLDAYGRASIFLEPTSYTFVLAPPSDSDPPIAPIWTVNGVTAYSTLFANFDISGTAGETITVNDVIYLSDGSGGATAGRWYKTDSDQVYSSTGAVSIGVALAGIASAASGSIRINGRMTGLSGLTTGTVYYVSATAGALTSTAPSNAIAIGRADSTTSLILEPNWGNAASSRGIVTTTAQAFSGIKTFSSQPIATVGASASLPATLGGVYFSDVTEHSIGNSQTNAVMSDTAIPANMLNTNGKQVLVHAGTSTDGAGSGFQQIKLDVGGTILDGTSFAGVARWSMRAIITRIDSDSVDVTLHGIRTAATWNRRTTRINGLDFTSEIDLRSVASTSVDDTTSQTYFIAWAIG